MDRLQEQVLSKIKWEFWENVHLDFHDEKWDGKHFYIDITSEKFIWKTKLEQSRLVYNTLDEFMKTGSIHALRMKCNIPE